MNLICPVCGAALAADDTKFSCASRHSFDRARSGYVNLLQKQRSRVRGDDAAMVRARRDFLDAGYYQPLLDALICAVRDAAPVSVADIGCGEGWYACGILHALAPQTPQLAGFDISPDALRYAANRARHEGLSQQTVWAAASANRIPLADGAADCVLNLFAPCVPAEFARILGRGGRLIRAVPLERHLWELKCAVYEKPYENRPVLTAPEGFRLIGLERICCRIAPEGETLQNLFAMTPYAHKTAQADADKLRSISRLETEIAFGLLICEKEGKYAK